MEAIDGPTTASVSGTRSEHGNDEDNDSDAINTGNMQN